MATFPSGSFFCSALFEDVISYDTTCVLACVYRPGEKQRESKRGQEKDILQHQATSILYRCKRKTSYSTEHKYRYHIPLDLESLLLYSKYMLHSLSMHASPSMRGIIEGTREASAPRDEWMVSGVIEMMRDRVTF